MSKKKSTPMTSDAMKRIQSGHSKKNDGKVKKGTFPARAQSTVDKKKSDSKK